MLLLHDAETLRSGTVAPVAGTVTLWPRALWPGAVVMLPGAVPLLSPGEVTPLSTGTVALLQWSVCHPRWSKILFSKYGRVEWPDLCCPKPTDNV